MIEIDPKFYLGDSFLVRWICPMCGERTHIRLGDVDTAACPHCDQTLSEADRQSLRGFRKFIA